VKRANGAFFNGDGFDEKGMSSCLGNAILMHRPDDVKLAGSTLDHRDLMVGGDGKTVGYIEKPDRC